MTAVVRVGDLPRLVLPEEYGRGLQGGAELHVWLLDVSGSEVSRMEAWSAALLGEDERRRARGIMSAEARRDHLAGRLALRLLLSAYCPDVSPRDWVLTRTGGGRPIVSAPHHHARIVPSFSVSHSEGHLALAFHANGEPGVDLESASRPVNMTGLARRYFSSAEAGRLEALSGEALRAGFLRCWTLKEASVKADGAGLAGELARRSFLCTEEDGIVTRPPDGRRWQYWSWRWPPSRMLAVALRHPAGWQGVPATCHPFTLSLPDGGIAAATVADACESAVV